MAAATYNFVVMVTPRKHVNWSHNGSSWMEFASMLPKPHSRNRAAIISYQINHRIKWYKSNISLKTFKLHMTHYVAASLYLAFVSYRRNLVAYYITATSAQRMPVRLSVNMLWNEALRTARRWERSIFFIKSTAICTATWMTETSWSECRYATEPRGGTDVVENHLLL